MSLSDSDDQELLLKVSSNFFVDQFVFRELLVILENLIIKIAFSILC